MRRQTRELMWPMNYSDEGFDEEVVEADHPGSWQKWKEKILSQWNKVELTSNILNSHSGYCLNKNI